MTYIITDKKYTKVYKDVLHLSLYNTFVAVMMFPIEAFLGNKPDHCK